MLKFLRGSRQTALIWWLVVIAIAVTFIIGFSVAPNIVGTQEVRGSTVLGTVNGQPLTQTEFQGTYNLLAQNFVAQYGRDPEEREQAVLRGQAWQQLVTEKAILQEGRRLGLTASDPEVLFAVRNTPPPSVRLEPVFQTNGEFDPQKYMAALSDPSINWHPLEEQVRRTLPAQKLEERLLATAKFSEPELVQGFRHQHERVRVTAARWLPVPGPLDTARITEQALRDYYTAHPGRFSGPAEANLTLLVVAKKVSPEDDHAALDRARALVQQARAGADFAQLARDHSEGPTADQGGEIPRDIPLAQLPPDIAGRAATVADSAVFDPVREGTRYYVLQLRRSPTPGPQPMFRMRQIVISIRISGTELQEDMTRLQKLRKEARSRGLDGAAARMGLPTRETGWISANSFVNELFALPHALQFGLSSPKGAVSPIYDQDANWVLLQVKDRREEGVRRFEDVHQQARAYVEREERLLGPRRAAERALAAIRAGTGFEEAARAESASTIEATGLFTRSSPPPQLAGSNIAVGVAFGLPVGQIGGPVSTPGGVLLLRKDAFEPAPMASYDSLKAQVARTLLSARQNRGFGAWLEWMRATSEVEDRRGEVLGVD